MMKKALWICGILAILAIVGTGYLTRSGPDATVDSFEQPQTITTKIDASVMPTDNVAGIPQEGSTSTSHSHSADSGCTSCAQHAAHASATGSPHAERPALELTKAIQHELFNVGKNSPIAFALPGGGTAVGTVEMTWLKNGRTVFVQGNLTAPRIGRFFFQRESGEDPTSGMGGAITFTEGETAYRVELTANGITELQEKHVDEVICHRYSMPPAEQMADDEIQEIPADHPENIGIPDYQNGVIPLSSLPGALAVVYLDFDGEPGPHQGWADTDAAAYNLSTAQIKDMWARVAEEFAPFNINVTTDLQVYLDAQETSRQRCIITPTTEVYGQPAGGVAYLNGFNSPGDTPCWCFYHGSSGALVVAHEVGHTLGLSHDGSSAGAYYGGHGSGDMSWGPIMGAPYGSSITHWSKGEYNDANQTQDDLAIIDGFNNIALRTDDHGDTLGTATLLEVHPDNSVNNKGIIETDADSDGFKFTVTASSSVSLTVNTAVPGANLDVLAEIVNSSDTVVATANPDGALNATVGATLGAGDYFLRVTGVGRDPVLGDGFSSYGSLGFYNVTGTVPNAVQPDRFSLAENPAPAASVGTVVPRNSHGADPITFTITSGNGNGAFALNSSNGQLTVADAAQFDYEALSTNYDDPATFELFVDITNTTTPALNETVRVVVEVTNVNEAPSISGGGAITLLEHTQTGTELLTFSGSDSDHYDFATFAITAGNTGNAFAIDATSGKLTVDADIDATANPSYTLTVTASDQGAPSLTDSTTVVVTVIDIAPGYMPGTISHAYYEGIGGSSVSDLTSAPDFPHGPDYLTERTRIETSSYGDSYGSVFRGFVIPPTTGSYTFWVSSDDASQLHLSTDANPANMSEIASVADWTDFNQWNKHGSQQSTPRTLTAGQPYYLEIRHKEGGGLDHVSAAWQGPGFSREIIPGLYLAPYIPNYSPSIEAATHSIPENAFIGTAVATAVPSDPNSGDSHSQFTIIGGDSGNAFSIDAITGVITVTDTAQLTAGGTFNLQVQTTDDGTPAYSGSGTITVNITTPTALMEGTLIQEIWTGISGSTVSLLTSHPNYPNSANYTRTLSSFDSGEGIADTYGSRIRGYVIPPTTGSYTFYVSSDDHSQLLLSTDDNPANATTVATVSTGDGWTGYNQWDKFSEQQATPVTLTAGQKYYIETLHKEGGGGDHVSVGWSGPGITGTAVIDGAYLEGFSLNEAPIWDAAPYTFSADNSDPDGSAVGTVSATDDSADALFYNILSGNESGGFAIDQNTGAITIGNHLSLSAGVHVLQVGVQDQGGAGTYPLATATTDVTVNVGGVNSPPVWNTSPIWKSGVDGRAFSGTLLGEATDSNSDTIEYDKVSGNSWLTITTNGPLTGVPDMIGTNVFTVTADDGINPPVTNTLNIVVTAALSPAWLEDPIAGANGVISNAYNGTIFGKAIDTNSDPISYSLVGPSTWLSVAANGGLSGTPGTAGTHTFTVAVTDGIDGTNHATLNIYIAELPTVLIDNTTRNGSFELLDTAPAKTMFNTGNVSDWTGWPGSSEGDTGTDLASGGTQNGLHGTRVAFLQPGGAILNMTAHVIQEGDVIDYSFWNSLVARDAATISIVWDNAGTVKTITGTGVTAADGTQAIGQYTVLAGDAVIGSTLGVGIVSGGSWPEVDQVFLSVTPAAVNPVPAEDFGAVGSVAGGSGLVLSWTGIPGLSYTVQTNADLVSGSWGPLTTGISGNGTITVTNPITSDKLFYRIETE